MGRGAITADTLVWTEGMANWQRAGDIPGLFSGTGSSPVILPAEAHAAHGGYGGGPMSIELGIWELTWRSVVLWIGLIFFPLTPWVVAMYSRWMVSRVHVPQRPNLAFTGRAVTLLWYFAALVLLAIVATISSDLVNVVLIFAQPLLYWLLVKWFVANLSSDGQPLALSFSGSYWVYLGWNVLMVLSAFTIIGWAWVYVAQMRWICRHVQGTRREIVFHASGLEFLWRSLVTLFACLFIIPIPWVLRWFIGWQVSQLVLVERGAHAKA
jgi:hypothetical protein